MDDTEMIDIRGTPVADRVGLLPISQLILLLLPLLLTALKSSLTIFYLVILGNNNHIFN